MLSILALFAPALAHAERSATRAAGGEIHYLGKVNVNAAAADELEHIPGLTKAVIERIVQAREKAPITSLKSLKLPARAEKYLRTDGDSDFARIRKHPLQAIDGAAGADPATDSHLN
jgi:Helix-hairpin-helix motif